MQPHRLLVVLFDGVQSLDVTGPLEVFHGADQLAAERDHPHRYAIATASRGREPVRTSSGLVLQPDLDLDTVSAPHTLVVPGGAGTRTAEPGVIRWLRTHAPGTTRVVSVCTGAFLLAEAGILDGRRATTHWNYCGTLANQYPEVHVDPEPIFLRDGHVHTSAGVTAGIDLALALVEDDHGRDTALAVARHLVMFLRRPGNQTQFSTQLSTQVAQRAPLRDLQAWIADNPTADLSVPALAERASLSPRHFARAFSADVGMPPGRYVDHVRLETARRLLEDTTDGIEGVARDSGFGTAEAMRRAFVRVLGVSPAEYQRRF